MKSEDPQAEAIAELEGLDEGEKFVLVTQQKGALDDEWEMNINADMGDDTSNVPLVNMTGAMVYLMSMRFDGYALDEAAQDVLTAARLQAQGEMFTRE
ncbi:MAG: hypothetical protein ABEJ30_03590 [Halorientalis sp.]